MEQMVQGNGVDLWCESFGERTAPTILLIMGAGSQGVAWTSEFCVALAERGRHVVRYDARDTGKSTSRPFDDAPYTISDLAADATAVLDGLGVPAAHIVGLSLGGMVAQELAIDHAARVLTLTSWMSTPTVTAAVPGFWQRDDLPGARPEVEQAFAKLAATPPQTSEEQVAATLELLRVVAGPGITFDEEAHRRLRLLEIERANDLPMAANHNLAVMRSRDRSGLLPSITVPALVIHGSDDPIVPVEHGLATANAIPDAEVLIIDGMGHDLPFVSYPFTATIIDALIRHTDGGASRAA